MRYLLGFLCVCALGVMPLVGCFNDFLESESCDGVVCPDDGNGCTVEYCVCLGWWCDAECVSASAVNGTDCTFDGIAGVCVAGVCGENLCEVVVCEDNDDPCTDPRCDYVDGTCKFRMTVCNDDNDCTEDGPCVPPDGCIFTPIPDVGALCFGEFPEGYGYCEAGICVPPVCDPVSGEVLECPTDEGLFCCPNYANCRPQCPAAPLVNR